jgi:hypothetical protein
MMANRDEVVKLALSLDPAGRAYVADILEASLRSEGFASAEIEIAWAEKSNADWPRMIAVKSRLLRAPAWIASVNDSLSAEL